MTFLFNTRENSIFLLNIWDFLETSWKGITFALNSLVSSFNMSFTKFIILFIYSSLESDMRLCAQTTLCL